MSSNTSDTGATELPPAEQAQDMATPTPKKMREIRTGGVTVRFPAEPPKLTPRAARALLKIIVEAADKQRKEELSEAKADDRRGQTRQQ